MWRTLRRGVADLEIVGGLVIIGAVLLFLACNITCNFKVPCSGTKIGQIVKISDEGILCTTTEAQLIRGGFTDGSGVLGGQPFDFTIRDPQLLADAKWALQSAQEVEITYEAKLISSRTNSAHGVFLTKIVPIPKPKLEKIQK